MIKKEFVETRDDGIKLYRTYSDGEFFIKKNGTDEIYSEAIDAENSGFTYTETDIPIEPEPTSDVEQKAAAFDYLTGRGDSNE